MSDIKATQVMKTPDPGAPHDAGVEPWTFATLRRDYWRVAVVGVLAMLIAYLGSFIVAPTYAATSRVLLRGRDTTILNSTGADLSQQGGVIDSQLATALSDTQSALVSNRQAATTIVDELHLDRPKAEKNGPIAKLERGLASAYKHARGYLGAGFYKDPGRHEAAVQTVAKGLTAQQVHDGFALDITGTWDDAKSAAAIANAAADLLVKQSNQRFRTEAATYRDFLRKQVDKAVEAENQAAVRVADYKTANGITADPTASAQLSQQSADSLRAQVNAAQAELDADRAQVASLDSQLASTPQTVETNQNITTGRSSTDIKNSAPNPVYQTLLGQRQSAQANVAAVSARLGALQSALGGATGDPGTVSQQQLELDKRQLDLTIATDTRQKLAAQLENASVNAQSPQVELTKVATAGAPTYPVSPKRYLFLAVGLFLGALLGFVWSFLRIQRRSVPLVPAHTNGAANREIEELDDIDLTEPAAPVPASSATPRSHAD
jgi:uncharacterized protein involved in exopolysaccharide biosynthesis